MTASIPALLAACAVLAVGATARHGRGDRSRELVVCQQADVSKRADMAARLGGALRSRFGLAADRRLDRRVGWMVILTLVLVVVAPPLGLMSVAAYAVVSLIRRRRRDRRTDRTLVDELPDVVDLLALAVSAGLTVPLAVAVVAERGNGRLAAELDRARRNASLGGSLADALDEIPGRLGEPVRPVTRVLSGALRDGTSIGPGLERVAVEVRTERRRAAEERARKVSVRLLFPLVSCTLPAFALLTVVPLLASTLRNLSL